MTIAMPAKTNTRAMPRASPSPSSHPQACRPASVSRYGMIQNCAIGAMRNEVMGAAETSSAVAAPNTRPCFSNGTTFWMTVCSADSTTGMSIM